MRSRDPPTSTTWQGSPGEWSKPFGYVSSSWSLDTPRACGSPHTCATLVASAVHPTVLNAL
eukprot:6151695-Lingulodinium_polyedra.AAC.1